MRALHFIAGLAVSASLVTPALAQVNLSAETANANGVPGNTVLALGEFANAAGVANIQVATGQIQHLMPERLWQGRRVLT